MKRVIVNGKSAQRVDFRSAVFKAREEFPVSVRVTWEQGDFARFVQEAADEGVTRIIAGGGDGTLNEAANILAQLPPEQRPELGVLPLGTANDFARSCQIPLNLEEALLLALGNESTPIDLGVIGQKHFLNVATAGFGAEVTRKTPPGLKNFLKGGAYTLVGVLNVMNFKPYEGSVHVDGKPLDKKGVVVAAVCNGRQAGGGQVLAANAFLNDGYLDFLVLPGI